MRPSVNTSRLPDCPGISLGFQVQVLKTLTEVPSSLGCGLGCGASHMAVWLAHNPEVNQADAPVREYQQVA